MFLPVIIPLICPVNDEVVPSPGIVRPLTDVVIPNPTVAAVTAAAGTVSIWSAIPSIVPVSYTHLTLPSNREV